MLISMYVTCIKKNGKIHHTINKIKLINKIRMVECENVKKKKMYPILSISISALSLKINYQTVDKIKLINRISLLYLLIPQTMDKSKI